MDYNRIHELRGMKFSEEKIAKKLGISRTTVRKFLAMSPDEFDRWINNASKRTQKLDPYEALIHQWLKEHPDLTATQVEDWLKERYVGLNVGESTVRRYVNQLRDKHNIPKMINSRVYTAVPELPMGKQAQVDFGETTVKDSLGASVRLWFIGFVLSHSRYKYVEWQNKPFTTKDVIRCHEHAITFYKGMPEEFVYDQDHLISVSENAGDIILTKEFQAYQQLRKFRIYLCRKSDPETKGKIEIVVKYVKYNFSKNRIFVNIDSWNEKAIDWLQRTANYKVHQTIKKRPIEVYALEKQHLKKVPETFSFEKDTNTSITRTVQKDNVIRFESNRYSVPAETYRPKQPNIVYIEVTEDRRLLIRFDPTGEVIAIHEIPLTSGNLVKNPMHERHKSKRSTKRIEDLAHHFRDQMQFYEFVAVLKGKYPRHIGDQLKILERLAESDPSLLDITLDKATTRKLTSANDFRDTLTSLKEEQVNKPSCKDYTGVTASKRNMEEYIAIMKGVSAV